MEERIMDNEIMEVSEDLVPASGSNLGGKLVVGAVVAGVGFGIYKLIKKFKSKGEKDAVAVNRYEPEEDVIDAEVVEELNKKLN